MSVLFYTVTEFKFTLNRGQKHMDPVFSMEEELPEEQRSDNDF